MNKDIYYCMCLFCVCSISYTVIHVGTCNGTHTVLGAWTFSYIIRYNVPFHLGDHLANGTTFAKSLGWSVYRGSTVHIF